MDWSNLLSGVPASDYIFQKTPYEEQIKEAVAMIKEADHIVIGAGAGLSTAAGLTYSGKRFEENFPEFIEKYGMKDMYSAGFYPFPSDEARFGYWSKHALVNRIAPPAMSLYQDLFDLVKEKDYFVLTTNVDAQFEKAGFKKDRIFATQGDYGKIQCAKGCHPRTYDAIELFEKMNNERTDCLIPTELVPKCPVCGGPMAMHLRCDQFFVEDENWYQAAKRYEEYLENTGNENTVLVELGVGFNTPTIIRFPFEKMMREHDNLRMIRLNMNEAVVPESFERRVIGIGGDMKKAIEDIIFMTQREKRIWLIQHLLAENPEYKEYSMPEGEQEQKDLLRALMNVRMPKPLSEEFLTIQDEYLQRENALAGITDIDDLNPVKGDKRLYLWQGDMTTLNVDAITNPANSQMLGCFRSLHNCADNIIHSKAGIQLRLKCNEIMEAQGHEEPTGQAKITPAYNLPSKYVIHTVGPIVGGHLTEEHRKLLESCYLSCLELAKEKQLTSIAFCCISTGVFMFPNREAAEIAVRTVKRFLDETGSEMKVVFNVFKDVDRDIYEKLLK